MGFFSDDTKPRVTADEFKKVRSALSVQGFSTKEINRVEEIFRGDMYEEKEADNGVDEFELKAAITWMKAHSDEIYLSERQINIVEEEMMKKIKS